MDNVVFLKVDVDEAEDVAGEYNISAMPTFVFIKDGKKVSASVPVLSVFFYVRNKYPGQILASFKLLFMRNIFMLRLI